MELEIRERANEIGLQRERAELAASPHLHGGGSYALIQVWDKLLQME
jgi:hypothetical protein